MAQPELLEVVWRAMDAHDEELENDQGDDYTQTTEEYLPHATLHSNREANYESQAFLEQRAALLENTRELMDRLARSVIKGRHLFAYTAPAKHECAPYLNSLSTQSTTGCRSLDHFDCTAPPAGDGSSASSDSEVDHDSSSHSPSPDVDLSAREEELADESDSSSDSSSSSDDESHNSTTDEDDADTVLNDDSYMHDTLADLDPEHEERVRQIERQPHFFQLRVLQYRVINLSGIKWDERLVGDGYDDAVKEGHGIASVGQVIQFDCVMPRAALYMEGENGVQFEIHRPDDYAVGLFFTDGNYTVNQTSDAAAIFDDREADPVRRAQFFRDTYVNQNDQPSSFLGEAYMKPSSYWKNASCADDPPAPKIISEDGTHIVYVHMRVVLTMAHLAALQLWETVTYNGPSVPLSQSSEMYYKYGRTRRALHQYIRANPFAPGAYGHFFTHQLGGEGTLNYTEYNAMRQYIAEAKLRCVTHSLQYTKEMRSELDNNVLSAHALSPITQKKNSNALASFSVHSAHLIRSWGDPDSMRYGKAAYREIPNTDDYASDWKTHMENPDTRPVPRVEPYGLQPLYFGVDSFVSRDVGARVNPLKHNSAFTKVQHVLSRNTKVSDDLFDENAWAAEAVGLHKNTDSAHDKHLFPFITSFTSDSATPTQMPQEVGLLRWFNGSFIPQAIALILQPSVLGLYHDSTTLSRTHWLRDSLDRFKNYYATDMLERGTLNFYNKRHLVQACALLSFLPKVVRNEVKQALYGAECRQWYAGSWYTQRLLGVREPVRVDLDPRPMALRMTVQQQCISLAKYIAESLANSDTKSLLQEFMCWNNKYAREWNTTRLDYALQVEKYYLDHGMLPPRQNLGEAHEPAHYAQNLQEQQEVEQRLARIARIEQRYTMLFDEPRSTRGSSATYFSWVRWYMSTFAMPIVLHRLLTEEVRFNMYELPALLCEAWNIPETPVNSSMFSSEGHLERGIVGTLVSCFYNVNNEDIHPRFSIVTEDEENANEMQWLQWFSLPMFDRGNYAAFFAKSMLSEPLADPGEVRYDIEFAYLDLWAQTDSNTNGWEHLNVSEDTVGFQMLAMVYGKAPQSDAPWFVRPVFSLIGCLASVIQGLEDSIQEECDRNAHNASSSTNFMPDKDECARAHFARMTRHDQRKRRVLLETIWRLKETRWSPRFVKLIDNIRYSLQPEMQKRMEHCYDALEKETQKMYWNPRISQSVDRTIENTWLRQVVKNYHHAIQNMKVFAQMDTTRLQFSVDNFIDVLTNRVGDLARVFSQALTRAEYSRTALDFLDTHLNLSERRRELERLSNTNMYSDFFGAGLRNVVHQLDPLLSRALDRKQTDAPYWEDGEMDL